MRSGVPVYSVILFLILSSFRPAGAIITKQEPGRNLSAPTGEYAGRGWEFTGRWGGFLGTPIAPHYFVTAKHLGGAVGQKLFYRGAAYTAVESLPCPDSDLAVWRVAETFPSWAPLYTKNDEIEKPIFMTGCGTARGVPVRTREGKLRGWRWGADDHRQSWGMNRVSGIMSYTMPGAQWKNEILNFTFDEDGPPNEGMVSGSDSGGAVFIRDTDGVWKLAGIIYGVDSTHFSPTEARKDASPAALFDTRGLYEKVRQTGEMRYRDSLRSSPEPTTAGATRMSSSLPFLRKVVPDLRPFPLQQVILGSSAVGMALGLVLFLRRQREIRRRRRGR